MARKAKSKKDAKTQSKVATGGASNEKKNKNASELSSSLSPQSNSSNSTKSSNILMVAVLMAILSIGVGLFLGSREATSEGGAIIPQSSKVKEQDSTATTATAMRRKRKEPLPILDELFPNQSLDQAWEAYPLLSTIYSTSKFMALSSPDDPSTIIPIVRVPSEQQQHEEEGNNKDYNSVNNHTKRLSFFQKLFHIDNIAELLSNPNLVHLKDYKVAKKVIRNNEEFVGMVPGEHIPLDQLQQHFQYGGFSLIVNNLQKRWANVAQLARGLHDETGANSVTANLYVTPGTFDHLGTAKQQRQQQQQQNSHAPTTSTPSLYVKQRSAFEAHWDWMDVIVLQISGRKLWSVAQVPIVEYLSTEDLKRKPTLPEMEFYLQKEQRYREFLLQPGDALYIPRGWIHNASTIGPDVHLTSSSIPDSNVYEEKDEFFLKEHGEEPSLHITFGIEHSCNTTYEGLLHHAVQMFYSHNDGGNIANVALQKHLCPGAKLGIKWKMLLHYAISDVARRGCVLTDVNDHPTAFDSVEEKDTLKHHKDACILRKSVPRGDAWREIDSMKQEQRKRHQKGEGDDKHNSIHTSYSKALNILTKLSNLDDIVNFIHRLQELSSKGELGTFCMFGQTNFDILYCPANTVSSANLSKALFDQILMEFKVFAEKHLQEVLDEWEAILSHGRTENQNQYDLELKAVGQDPPTSLRSLY